MTSSALRLPVRACLLGALLAALCAGACGEDGKGLPGRCEALPLYDITDHAGNGPTLADNECVTPPGDARSPSNPSPSEDGAGGSS
jgi:hypothetical protein